jgi:hypothetical protein
MFQHVQQNHRLQAVVIDRPRMPQVMDSDVLDPSSPNVFDGFGHEIETGDVVTALFELNQISPGSNPAFDQTPRSRRESVEQPEHQTTFGDMPPVVVFEFDQLCQMTGIHVGFHRIAIGE